MPKAFIKIAYRQIIDNNAQSNFEKSVLNFSYQEYKMKQQTYNADGSIKTFTALKQKDGRANSLHYKSGFAVAALIAALKNTITVMQDGTEIPFIFDTYKFEVIESDITNEQLHKVAIQYISDTLTLYEIIGAYLLVAKNDKAIDGLIDTFLIKVQPGLQIINYQEFALQDSLNFIDNII